jgi:hypothetical protein
LAKASHHSGAYYLAGYSVELALKAFVARQFRSEIIPDWPFFKDARTHRLDQLIKLAGLHADLISALSRDARFDAHWQVVESWRTDSRYDMISAAETARLIEALEDGHHGAMRWIRTHW